MTFMVYLFIGIVLFTIMLICDMIESRMKGKKGDIFDRIRDIDIKEGKRPMSDKMIIAVIVVCITCWPTVLGWTIIKKIERHIH